MAERRAFTLVEVLVVVGVVALLAGLLLPTLAGARHAARGVACLANLRSLATLTRLYADANKGFSPTIGVPYAAPPNWALVLQQMSGRLGTTTGDLYFSGSVLVCPATRAALGAQMTRTYAINATGHAGQSAASDGASLRLGSAAVGSTPPDPDNYDIEQASISLDRVIAPAQSPLLVDSIGSAGPGRTASMIDFRQDAHIRERLSTVHALRGIALTQGGSGAPPTSPGGTPGATSVFNAALVDGSVRTQTGVPTAWRVALP